MRAFVDHSTTAGGNSLNLTPRVEGLRSSLRDRLSSLREIRGGVLAVAGLAVATVVGASYATERVGKAFEDVVDKVGAYYDATPTVLDDCDPATLAVARYVSSRAGIVCGDAGTQQAYISAVTNRKPG